MNRANSGDRHVWDREDLSQESTIRELMSESTKTHKCWCRRRITGNHIRCAHCLGSFHDLNGWSKAWDETIDIDQWKEGQRMAAEIEPSKLRKQLQEQGFTVIDKSRGGWQVKSPAGKGMVHMHTSQLSSAPHTVKNIMKQLENIGYRSDHLTWQKEQSDQLAAQKAQDEEALKEQLPFVCEACGRRSPQKMNLYRHISKKHPELWATMQAEEAQTRKREAAEKAAAAPTPLPPAEAGKNGRPAATKVVRRSVPDEELSNVARMRKLHDRIKQGSELVSEAATRMLERYEQMDADNRELKARLDKVERKVAGLVDAL